MMTIIIIVSIVSISSIRSSRSSMMIGMHMTSFFFSAREAAQIAQSQVAWNIAEAAKWITGV